ncbi:LytR/AlgR family response regulator transcription factor [Enterococcus sp. AZ192]|uniref:LytR/AlgR family response regulator transcription factor n=1 Tax=unclassified Enterococcus TaxID=2608891 RepID=UPI003D297307
MYKIALCDDEAFQSTKLEKMIEVHLSEQNIEFEIDIYEQGESLLRAIKQQTTVYQIIFLDIEMSGINGIETAKKIREHDEHVLLNYITSYDKYSLASFEVSPFRYLLKPIEKQKINFLLDSAIEKINLGNHYLFFKSNRRHYQLCHDQIIMISSEKGRQIRIELTSEEQDIVFYGKIKELEQTLNLLIFVKVNHGTIINMNCIKSVEDQLIHLINGKSVSISRGKRKQFSEAYNHFIERSIGI